MKAVLYGRYSSDKQRDASITDQFRNCERAAEQEGLEVIARYDDKGISGTTTDRPGYQAMLADAKDRKFDVLIVDDLSRISREDIEMKQVVKRFKFWGIRIISVSDGFDSDSKGYKLHVGVKGLMNELYIDDLREKTHRGLTGQALKGNNTGGRSYGYRHIPTEDPSRRDEYGRPVVTAVRREIDEAQAKWVRQIFEWYANGRSPRWIAGELNRLGVPSPRNSTWAASAIHGNPEMGTGLLNNPLYDGVYIWNRSEWVKDPETGKRRRRLRPEDEWIRTDMPELRIVPKGLWESVRKRQQSKREKSAAIRKALHDNARTGAGSKYLFSGLLKCGECSANYIIADSYRYGCSTNVNRGPAACSNGIRVRRTLVEQLLLDGIKRDLFTPEGIELFKRETTRLLTEYKARQKPDHAALRKRLTKIEKEIDNIMDAIKAGIITPSTKGALTEAEAAKVELEKALHVDTSHLDRIAVVLPGAVDRFRELVENLETVAHRDMARARTQIKHLVGGEIKLIPTGEGYLEAELAGDYAGLVKLANESPGARGTGAKLSLVAGARNQLYLLFAAPGLMAR